MTISKNGTAIAVFAIEGILKMFGVEFDEGSVLALVNAVVVTISFLTMVYHQVAERDDTVAMMFKV